MQECSRGTAASISIDISSGINPHVINEIHRSGVYMDRLSVEEFCRLTRILLRYFFTQICAISIVTSKKISRETQL